MQNALQMDMALTGLFGGGTAKTQGAFDLPRSNADPQATGHSSTQPDAPKTRAGTDGRDTGVSQFQTVFEDIMSTGELVISDLPQTKDTGQDTDTDMSLGTSRDALLLLEAVFLTLQSDEIELDGLLGGNTTLTQNAKVLLSELTDRMGTTQSADIEIREMIMMVHDIVKSSRQTFGAMADQIAALTPLDERPFPALVTPLIARSMSTPITAQDGNDVAGPMPRAMAIPDDRAQGTALAPIRSSQSATTGGTAPKSLLIDDPHISALNDKGWVPAPSQARMIAQKQVATEAATSLQNTVTQSVDQTTQSLPSLSPIARDLVEPHKPINTALDQARLTPSDDRHKELARDAATPRTAPQALAPMPSPQANTAPTLPVDAAVIDPTAAGSSRDGTGFDTLTDLTARELRNTGPTGTLGTPSQTPPSQMTPAQTQQVTRQIAFAIQNTPGRSVDITLNPAELGHVRISLSSAEAGMVVSIQVERAETLELMRRHADLLASDFRDIGYDGTRFSFEQSSGQWGSSDNTGRSSAPDPLIDGQSQSIAPNPSHNTPPASALRVGDGGIDIRI